MRLYRFILDLPVIAKVSAILAVVAVFSLSFGLVLRGKTAAIERAVAEQGRTLDLLQSARNASKAFGDMKYWNAEMANSLQDSSVDAAAKAKGVLFAQLEALKDEDAAQVAMLRKKANEIEDLSLSALDEYVMDERKAGNAYMAKARTLVGEVDQALAALTAKLEARAENARTLALKSARAALDISLPAMAGILVALAVAGAGLFFLVVAPLRKMTGAMLRLADGDTDIALPAQGQKDEIGDMAGAVEIFRTSMIEGRRLREQQRAAEEKARADKIRTLNALADDFEASVTEMVDIVAAAAGNMQASAHDLAETARSSGSKANGAAQSTEESAMTIEMVAEATEELKCSIQEVSGQISNSAQFAREATEAARESNEVVKTLGEAAGRIDGIVQIIEDIAEQTNLLALNATIEAARAGDAGRGFSVVASEVKGLAEQTTNATRDIGVQINEIQQVARVCVEQISTVTASIGQIEERLAAVSAAAEEQSATTGDISDSIRQAAMHSKQISDIVRQLAEASSSTENTSVETHEATVEMTMQAESLGAKVREFSARVRSA